MRMACRTSRWIGWWIGAVAGTTNLLAAVCTWNGAGADSLASTPANWVASIAPTATVDEVLLDGTSGKPVTWNLTNTVAAWTQASTFTGTVTIATTYAAPFTNLHILGNCTLNRGTWNHNLNAGSEISRLHVTVGGDFTQGTGATINVNGRGYGPGQGPGRGESGNNNTRPAASYGGLGGNSLNPGFPYFPTYGDIYNPTNLGSGAYSAGGGAVRLIVKGTATINGTISSSRNLTPNLAEGSGGSIWITTAALSGTGLLDVGLPLGGGGTAQCGGGGGRIAVILTNGTSFAGVRMQAYGGKPSTSSSLRGAAGTIYRQTATQSDGQGTLTIDNNQVLTTTRTLLTPFQSNLNAFTSVIITNRGRLGLNTNTVWNLFPSGANLLAYGSSASYIALIHTNHVSFPASPVISRYTLYLYTNLNVRGDLTVTNATLHIRSMVHPNLTVNGHLTISTNGSITHESANEAYRLVMQVNSNLVIQQGGTLYADGIGFSPGTGPGKGDSQNSNTKPAASHGGLGAPKPGVAGQPVTYGSIFTPTNFGSGGQVYGGGAIQATVGGTTTLDGMISAMTATPGLAGAAGGSVYLTTTALQGNGMIRAYPPAFSPSSAQYGGGGGRIAVYLTGSSSFGSVAMRAWGHSVNRAAPYPGAAGTVYRQTAAQGAGRGTLMVDNNIAQSTSTNITTQLPPVIQTPPDDLRYVTLVMTNRARVELTGDLRMGDLLIAGANPRLHLRGYTLRLQASYHDSWGSTNNVVYEGGRIIWAVPGMLILLR